MAKFGGLTAECIAGAGLVSISDLAYDMAVDGIASGKARNLNKLASRGTFLMFSGLGNAWGGGESKAQKFTEGMFYASLGLTEIAAYHYVRSPN